MDQSEHLSSPPEIEKTQESSDTYYTCYLCGTFLFDRNEIEFHSPSQKDMDRRQGQLLPCSSVFLSSPPNFAYVEESKKYENSVKISCPGKGGKCQGKLGTLCWTGNQCSCGTWVTPAIQFIGSKIDMKKRI
jgi:dual specificity phosphatase 12